MYTHLDIQKIAGIIICFFDDLPYVGNNNQKSINYGCFSSILPYFKDEFDYPPGHILSITPGREDEGNLTITKIKNLLNTDFLKTQNSICLMSVFFYFESLVNFQVEEQKDSLDEGSNYLELNVLENQILVSGQFKSKDYILSDEDIAGDEWEIKYKKARNFCVPIFQKHLPEKELFFDDWREGLQEFIRRITYMCIEANECVEK